MWHVYGEQANSPMNQLIAEFNETEGKDKGIIINVTKITNASKIGSELEEVYLKNQVQIQCQIFIQDIFIMPKQVGLDKELLYGMMYLQEKEISNFVDEFLDAGM